MTAQLAILGVGGVGGALAAQTGALCIGTPRTVEALNSGGLTLIRGDRTLVTHPQATEQLRDPVALLVIAVKAPALEAALERIEPAAVADAVVLPLLNGLEHVAAIRERLGGYVVAGSIGGFEGFLRAPGVVEQRSPGATIRAASHELTTTELEKRLAPLNVPGIELRLSSDEREVLWEKAARLAVLASATAASGEPVGALRADPTWMARLLVALEEACLVATADGVDLSPTEQWAIIEAMPETLTTSTARDVAAGRPSELDAITGSVLRAADRLGVATPELGRLMEDACRPL
jgi:2-dehydropantoate 2-reductase